MSLLTPYQPIERKRMLTRRCLEVLAEFETGLGFDKNALVARDDILGDLPDRAPLP